MAGLWRRDRQGRLLTDLVTNAPAPGSTNRYGRHGEPYPELGKLDCAASFVTARYGPQFATDQKPYGARVLLAPPAILECPSLSCVTLRCTSLAGAMLAGGVAQKPPGVNFRCR